MPHQLPGAKCAASVMTQRWGVGPNISGDLPQLPSTATTTSPNSRLVPLSPTTSSSSSSSSPRPPRQPQRERLVSTRPTTVHAAKFPSCAVAQVRKLSGRYPLVLLLVALTHLLQPAMGKPWIEEQPRHVTFRTKLCQPVSSANLRKMMGAAFDENKMAPDMATAKRMFGSEFIDETSISGYQGDDPRVAYVLQSSDLVEDEKEWDSNEEEEEELRIRESGKDIYSEDRTVDEIEKETFMERRTWMPRGRILNRHLPNGISSKDNKKYRHKQGLSDTDFDDDSNRKRKTVYSDSYAYMRRRRRRSLEYPDGQNNWNDEEGETYDEEEGQNGVTDEYVNMDDDDYDEEEEDYIDSKDKKSKDILPLRLILSGKNKKLRRQLKKKFRQKTRYLKKTPPWQCEMKSKWLIMKPGVFPTVIRDGMCAPSKCFYRLYTCVPIQYQVKLIQRDPDNCNPLPSLSNGTIYEERWNLATHYATVGCNCAKANVKGGKGKKRRRD